MPVVHPRSAISSSRVSSTVMPVVSPRSTISSSRVSSTGAAPVVHPLVHST